MASKKLNQAVENTPATERIGTTTIENNNVPAKENNTAKEINVMLTNSNNADVTLINSLKQLGAILNLQTRTKPKYSLQEKWASAPAMQV